MIKINHRLIIIILGLIVLMVLVGCAKKDKTGLEKTPGTKKIEKETGVKMTKRGVKYIVNPDKLVSGGPPKDGIPSIDKPKFISVKEADKWIKDKELVMAIDYKGVERAYPLQILVWHEVVNDKIAGEPLAITYCPLCGSGVAYVRKINGREVEFGVSGKLYNSNLVMYDRKTNSYWSQVSGQAIVGELSGKKLKSIPIDTVPWRVWKKAHPDGKVLSRDTGFDRDYGKDPYGNYYEDSFILFPVDKKDSRIHPKTIVCGVEADGKYKAYTEKDIMDKGEIEDTLGGVKIKISRSKSGVVKVVNAVSGDEIVKKRVFWFAWYAFHPDTKVYGRP